MPFAGGGFEHPEESVWRAGPTDIGFRTDTYGDADSAIIDIGNLAACRIRVAGRIDGYAKVGNPLRGQSVRALPDLRLAGQRRGAAASGQHAGWSSAAASCSSPSSASPTAKLAADVSGSLHIEPRNGPMASAPCISTAARATTQRSGPRRCSSPSSSTRFTKPYKKQALILT